MKFLQYMSYILRHKWYVLHECMKRGLIVQGIMHDMSKFRPDEYVPYMNFFYGSKHTIRQADGYYKPTDTGNKAFDFAWLLHQKRNKHHWQWWILPEDDGGVKILEMPVQYRKELLADWLGASRAQGFGGDLATLRAWYHKNKKKMQLGPETQEWIEKEIHYHNT